MRLLTSRTRLQGGTNNDESVHHHDFHEHRHTEPNSDRASERTEKALVRESPENGVDQANQDRWERDPHSQEQTFLSSVNVRDLHEDTGGQDAKADPADEK